MDKYTSFYIDGLFFTLIVFLIIITVGFFITIAIELYDCYKKVVDKLTGNKLKTIYISSIATLVYDENKILIDEEFIKIKQTCYNLHHYLLDSYTFDFEMQFNYYNNHLCAFCLSFDPNYSHFIIYMNFIRNESNEIIGFDVEYDVYKKEWYEADKKIFFNSNDLIEIENYIRHLILGGVVDVEN